MSVTGSSPSPASFSGAESPGTTVALNAGAFSVSESSVSGYAQTGAVGCSGTIAVGETKTGPLTNEDQPAPLIVKKHVINDNGGTAVASNFTMSVTGSSPSPSSFAGSETGTNVTINAGSYSVSESSVFGYVGSSS